MTTQLKILGVAAIVAVAASVALVTAVSASAAEFQVESAPATLTGSLAEGETSFMRFGEAQLECESVTLSGELSSTSSTTMTLAPSYSGCSILGSSATVTVNGCEYVDHIEGEAEEGGSVDLVCEGEEGLVIDAIFACEIKLEPNQTGMPKASWKITMGPPQDIDRVVTVTGLAYTAKNCAFIKDGTYKNGEIESTETIKADKKGGGAQAIWIE